MPRYDTTNIEYLKAKLATVSGDDLTRPWSDYPCLIWDRGTSVPKGKLPPYGVLQIGKRQWRAHRLAYQTCIGPLEPTDSVLHKCDMPTCYRPVHLRKGTQGENMKDCMLKLRHCYGETHGCHILSKDQAAEILCRYQNGEKDQTMLANEYGISNSLVWRIVHRKLWKSLDHGHQTCSL